MQVWHVSFATDLEAVEAARKLNAEGVKCHVSRGFDTSPAVLVIYLPLGTEPELEGAVLKQSDEE